MISRHSAILNIMISMMQYGDLCCIFSVFCCWEIYCQSLYCLDRRRRAAVTVDTANACLSDGVAGSYRRLHQGVEELQSSGACLLHRTLLSITDCCLVTIYDFFLSLLHDICWHGLGCCNSVCQSVICVLCDNSKGLIVLICWHHMKGSHSSFPKQRRLVDDVPFHLKFALKMTHPVKKCWIWHISAASAFAVRCNEKKFSYHE